MVNIELKVTENNLNIKAILLDSQGLELNEKINSLTLAKIEVYR